MLIIIKNKTGRDCILTAVNIALILFLSEYFTIKNVASQEYPGCFLITEVGTVVELNNLCNKNNAQTSEPLEFNGLEFQPPIAGLKSGSIQGSVTNRSNKVIFLRKIYFQLLVNNRVVANSNVQVETGDGLKPGESLSFNTGIKSEKTGNLPEDGVKVEVTKYE